MWAIRRYMRRLISKSHLQGQLRPSKSTGGLSVYGLAGLVLVAEVFRDILRVCSNSLVSGFCIRPSETNPCSDGGIFSFDCSCLRSPSSTLLSSNALSGTFLSLRLSRIGVRADIACESSSINGLLSKEFLIEVSRLCRSRGLLGLRTEDLPLSM